LRRVLGRLDAWLHDISPLLTLLALAFALAIVLLPQRSALISKLTLVVAVLMIAIRPVLRFSSATQRRLRVAATYAVSLVFVPALLIVEDIRSTVHQTEPVLKTALDIDSRVRQIEKKITIPHAPIPITVRNSPLGGLYNASYDSRVGIQFDSKLPSPAINIPGPGYTHVFAAGHQGNQWVIQDDGASFSYDRHDGGFQAPWASSGGFISFPDAQVNRFVYQYLRFDCKVSASQGRPDLGIRLAVDDSSISWPDKEVAAYELASMSQGVRSRPLSDRWQNYEIYTLSLDDQPRVNSKRPNIDLNEINKLVFFVNDSMLGKSPKGTVWIRNIVFSTSRQSDQP